MSAIQKRCRCDDSIVTYVSQVRRDHLGNARGLRVEGVVCRYLWIEAVMTGQGKPPGWIRTLSSLKSMSPYKGIFVNRLPEPAKTQSGVKEDEKDKTTKAAPEAPAAPGS